MLANLLFAYREVPQASTGFSPFELLYGRAVNGPLDVLKNILSISDKLPKMTELMKSNLSNAQERQRKWYNRNARTCEFKPGQQVLVLLRTSSSKLLAQWLGPYEIIAFSHALN